MMTELLTTNPARRALNFIQDFSTIGRELDSNISGNIRVRRVLGKMFDLKATDTSSLMIVISDLWKLPVQIRQSIDKVGLESDAFEHVMVDLENVLTVLTLDYEFYLVNRSITDGLKGSLGMIGSILNKDLPEVMLAETTLDELLKAIDELEDGVRKSGADKEFIEFVLHKIDSIRYSLNHYETLGPDEVMSRVDQMFGGVLRQHQKLTSTNGKKVLIRNLLQIGSSIIFVLNALNGSYELAENLNKFVNAGIQLDAEIINPDDGLLADTSEPKDARKS
jgi:hypothetical protein